MDLLGLLPALARPGRPHLSPPSPPRAVPAAVRPAAWDKSRRPQPARLGPGPRSGVVVLRAERGLPRRAEYGRVRGAPDQPSAEGRSRGRPVCCVHRFVVSRERGVI